MGFVVVECLGSNAIYFVDNVFPYSFLLDLRRIRVFQRIRDSKYQYTLWNLHYSLL